MPQDEDSSSQSPKQENDDLSDKSQAWWKQDTSKTKEASSISWWQDINNFTFSSIPKKGYIIIGVFLILVLIGVLFIYPMYKFNTAIKNGDNYFEVKQWDQAIQEYQKAFILSLNMNWGNQHNDVSEKIGNTYFKKGITLAAQKNYISAINVVKMISKTHKNYKDTQEYIKKWVKLENDKILTQAVNLASKGDVKQALDEIKTIPSGAHNYKNAQEYIKKWVKLENDKILTQAVNLASKGDVKQALDEIKTIPSRAHNYKNAQEYINNWEAILKRQEEEARERALYASSDLELITWSWSKTGEYFTEANGQVKNISSQNLKNVQAVVSFYDSNGTFITSSDALIEYNPILPNQISPFSVIKKYNPAMSTARVEFKFLMGGTISTYRKKD